MRDVWNAPRGSKAFASNCLTWYKWGFCSREELAAAEPDVLLDDLTELLEVLELPEAD